MRYKSNKLRKLEKERKSIFTDNLKCCIICNEPASDINEIFMGRNRLNSIKHNLCIPLCRKCHQKYHLDRKMQLYWMKRAQIEFETHHSQEEWMKIFLRNYKD